MERIAIISKDQDFAQALGEQLEQQLGIACSFVDTVEDAQAVALAISTEEQTYPSPFVMQCGKPPFSLPILIRQVSALMQKRADDDKLTVKDYELDIRKKLLIHTISKQQTDITDKEVKLLTALAEAGPAGMQKEQLLKRVWGFDTALDTHTLETHIYRLRAKFRELGNDEIIANIDGGYKLEE